MEQLLDDVDACLSKEQVAEVVQDRYRALEEHAAEPKGQTVATSIMLAYYEKKKREEEDDDDDESDEEEEEAKKRQRPNNRERRARATMAEIKPFLDRVFESIGGMQATSAFERELCRLSRYPDYVLVLK